MQLILNFSKTNICMQDQSMYVDGNIFKYATVIADPKYVMSCRV